MNVSPPDLEIRGGRLYIWVIGRKLKTEILDTTESREAKMEIPDKTNRGEHE